MLKKTGKKYKSIKVCSKKVCIYIYICIYIQKVFVHPLHKNNRYLRLSPNFSRINFRGEDEWYVIDIYVEGTISQLAFRTDIKFEEIDINITRERQIIK
jgi:hypothetical protein